MSTATAASLGNEGRRIREIDYVKAFCILAMVIEHCYGVFYAGVNDYDAQDIEPAFFTILNICNVLIGPSAFMFCMGFTVDAGRTHEAKDCLTRGVSIFFMGLLLNYIRGTFARNVFFFTWDTDVLCRQMIDVLGGDVLLFAGLGFILLGLLKKCRLNAWGIFIAAIGFSVIGTLFRYTDTGEAISNSVLGFFVGTNSESYFPLFNWFIFIAAGNLFCFYYKKIKNIKKFYAIGIPVSIALGVTYLILAFNCVGPFQTMGEEEALCYWLNPCDAIGCIALIFVFVGIGWIVSELIEKLNLKKNPLLYIAANLSMIYIIHDILIFWFDIWFNYGLGWVKLTESPLVVCLYALILLLVSVGLTELYKKYWRTAVQGFLKKRAALFAVIVTLIIAVCCTLASTHGLTEVPNFTNGYEVEGMGYISYSDFEE